jgi:hypothetical protein
VTTQWRLPVLTIHIHRTVATIIFHLLATAKGNTVPSPGNKFHVTPAAIYSVLLVVMEKTARYTNPSVENAAPQLRRLVVGFPPRRPGFDARSGLMVFVVDKMRWGRFSLSTSGSRPNSHCTNLFTLIIVYHPGLVQ